MDVYMDHLNPAITNLKIPSSMEGIIDFELDAIINFNDDDGLYLHEPLNVHAETPEADFYSVYARYDRDDPGHNPLECIADCADYQTALDLCFRLGEMLKKNNDAALSNQSRLI